MEPLERPLTIYEIQVTFHPGNIGSPAPLFTFQGNIDPETNTITVLPGLAMIIFSLETEEMMPPEFGQAIFQTSPVQWMNAQDGTPTETPGMFTVQRAHGTAVTLLDFNANMQGPAETHVFNLVVAYKGQTYGADPSIVNQPLG
jgi:hypothetical protein